MAKSLRGIPLSARDDTGVLSQARPMMASGARRGGRRHGAARRQNRENRNILFLARTQRIKQDYLTINDNKWQQMTINDNVFCSCSIFASETRRERPSRLEVLGQDLWCEATHHFLMRNRSRSAKFKQAWLALAKPRFCNVKGKTSALWLIDTISKEENICSVNRGGQLSQWADLVTKKLAAELQVKARCACG